MIGRFHVITDSVLQSRYSHAELAELAIAGGADTIQYRSKETEFRRLMNEAGAVRDVCRRAGILFIVNDRVDLCTAIGADGVHLGREDMPVELARKILGPEKIIGATIRNAEHCIAAQNLSANYVGLGPIFGTASKTVGMEPLGTSVVTAVKSVATVPVIAIAGITHANVQSVLAAGADGIAVISAVCCAEDVTGAALEFCRKLF